MMSEEVKAEDSEVNAEVTEGEGAVEPEQQQQQDDENNEAAPAPAEEEEANETEEAPDTGADTEAGGATDAEVPPMQSEVIAQSNVEETEGMDLAPPSDENPPIASDVTVEAIDNSVETPALVDSQAEKAEEATDETVIAEGQGEDGGVEEQTEEAPERVHEETEEGGEGQGKGEEAAPAATPAQEGEEKGEEGKVGAEAEDETKATEGSAQEVEPTGEKEADDGAAEEHKAADESTNITSTQGDGEAAQATSEPAIADATTAPAPAPGGGEPEQAQAQAQEPQEAQDDASGAPQVDVGKETSADTQSMSKANVSVTGETTTTAFPIDKPLGELRLFLGKAMDVPEGFLEIQYSGQILDMDLTLAQLGAVPAGTIELNLYSTNEAFPTKPLQSRSDYVMPDIITVTVRDVDGEVKNVNVEIERFAGHKPFLGGFKHKDSGIQFLNASSQTNVKLRPWDGKTRFCRDAQTVEEKRQPQQTHYNTSTQMTGIGVYVSNMSDKLVKPGRYETADEFHTKRQSATVVIQSYFRRWASKNLVEGLREDRDVRLEWERAEEIRKRKEKEDRIKREFDRRMNPKTKEDFDLLYHALEKWRNEETAEINKSLSGAKRKAALSMLLEQETQLIAAISRHKIDCDKTNKEKAIKTFLDKASAPKKWRGEDGKMTEMDTPYTLRAQQLKDIYNSINMKYLTQDERLDILLTLKHTVKEHDCKLTVDIIELIDREADLLMRGVKEDNLDGLRKRISTLFLQYCKTPAFNPEAARLIKVPQDPSTLRKGVYYCSSCGLYLPSTEFPLSSNSSSPGKCRRCRKIDNDARTRQDYSHYVYMLRQLRLAEEKMNDGSRVALLLQEQDLQYLVENIWGGQSALSQWEDLYDLVLVRWNRWHEWSPWNCILLTKDEAIAHEKVENLDESYRDVFLNKVRQKHSLARNYFSRLAGMAEKVRPIQPRRDKRVLSTDQDDARKELTELSTIT